MEPFCCLILVFLWVHAAGSLTEKLKISQPERLEVSRTEKPALECTHDCGDDDVELKLTILKGKNKSTVCSGTTLSSNQSIEARGLLHCQMKRLPNKISVNIHGFNSSLVDNYFCKIEKMYPPPYQSGVGDGTVIYISSECPRLSFILVVGILGFLLLFSMTCIFVLIIKCKTKKTNVNPVYEQMAPTRGR